MPSAEGIFLFEGFRFDRRAGGLFRGDDNGVPVPVPLGARALDVLGVLLARPGEIVSKDEIIAAVWPGRIVEDSNLPTQISALRRELDAGRSAGSCIQTVSGRGYRFVGAVTRHAAAIDAGTSRASQEQLCVFSPDGVEPSARPSRVPSVERRQLTLMICDLAGAAMLASRLDPEELREIMAAYHRAVTEMVDGYDGFVGSCMGDTVLACFGYPRAHEDDAERAVRAGLGIIDAVGCLDVKPFKLQTRVGVASGLVVVSEGSAQGQSVIGETPYLAARLKGLAEPDTVVIGAGTHRLTGDLFEYRDLGTVQVEGIAEPVRAWQVLRPSSVASRFEALHGSALSPFVGRAEEIDWLLRRWARAKVGEGQVVFVSGEPGIGKSRIVTALEERLHTEPYLRLRYFCSPYHQDSALYPMIEQLGRAAGLARDDAPSAKLDKLEALLVLAAPVAEDVALLADLLLLPASERHPLPNLSPQRKKERILEALIRQLEGLARQQPVVMIFEDVHWIDPTSRELLDLIIERVGKLPVLLVVTFRPEFQALSTGRPQVGTLTLNRLDRHDRTALVEQIAGCRGLSSEIVTQISDRTDGVPLFVEELTKAVLESADGPATVLGTNSASSLDIPATLHASLIARLDRLGTAAKEVAQIGAVVGRVFGYELVHRVAHRPDLEAVLERLTKAGLLFRRGLPPASSYLFKHALVQDAAYGTLLRLRRQQLHGRIAAVLEQEFCELIEIQPELLARHLTGAGDSERAAVQWLKAGQYAAAHSAHIEAIANLERGLALLPLLPDTTKRDSLEIELQLALGMSTIKAKGMISPAVGEAYGRAGELAEKHGDERRLFQALYGVWQHNVGADRIFAGRPLAERLLSVTGHANADPGLRLQAHHAAWTTFNTAGEPAGCREHCEIGRRLYDPERYQSHRDLYGGHDAGACAWMLGGQAEWMLGHPDRALASLNEAVALAERISHPPTLGGALSYAALLHVYRREPESILARLAAAQAVAAAQGLSAALNVQVLRGTALFLRGEVGDAIVCLRAGLPPGRTGGVRPLGLCMLGAALARQGDHAEALAAIIEALESVEVTGGGTWNIELHRSHGLILLAQNRISESEAALRRALQLARRQQAKSWELRAATSLARLWGEQGRRHEGRDLLAPIYGWFTEGFNTADLKEAKALFDDLR